MAFRFPRAYVFVALATIFFSSMEISLKSIAGDFNAVQVNLTRFALGGIALIPFALRELRRRHLRLGVLDILELAGLALVGIVISMGFYQLAVERAPASVVAVVFCSNTVFVLLFARAFLGHPVTRSKVAALCLAMGGMASILAPDAQTLGPAAICLSVLAPATFALYAVLSTPLCIKASGVLVTCATFLLGSLELLALVLVGHTDAGASLFDSVGLDFLVSTNLLAGYTWTSFLGMLYVGIGVSGVGYACYFMAAEAASPFTASLVFFFKPVLAPLLAWIVLGDALTFNLLLGIALFVSGSLCLFIPRLRDLQTLRRLTMARQMRHWRMARQHEAWRRMHHVYHAHPHRVDPVHLAADSVPVSHLEPHLAVGLQMRAGMLQLAREFSMGPKDSPEGAAGPEDTTRVGTGEIAPSHAERNGEQGAGSDGQPSA